MGSSRGHLIQIQQTERTKRKRNKCIKDFKTVRLTTLNDDVIQKILSCASYTIQDEERSPPIAVNTKIRRRLITDLYISSINTFLFPFSTPCLS